MARQITLLASDIYKKIRVSELLKQAWSKKDKEKNAPNILHLINRFNKTSLWVASMCVLPETVPARASTISYFIKVRLFELVAKRDTHWRLGCKGDA